MDSDKTTGRIAQVYTIVSPTLLRFNWSKRKRAWGYWSIDIDTMTASVLARRWDWCTETTFLWSDPIMGPKKHSQCPITIRPGDDDA